MTTPTIAPAVPWGERTSLLAKQTQYALSLDVLMTATGINLSVVGAADSKAEPYNGFDLHASFGGSALRTSHRGIGHLFDDVMVTMPEGLRCDVPTGPISSGQGQIGDPSDPSSNDLQMKLTANVGSSQQLLIDCSGVVDFDGGPAAFRLPEIKALKGSAFISTRYVSTSLSYRWLGRRQLFGVGRVRCTDVTSLGRLLAFSFDLYAAV